MICFDQKKELHISLAWILAYVVLMSVADGVSASLGVKKIITAPVCILLAALLFRFIKKHGLSERYGLCPFKGKLKNYLYFLPLGLIISANLWNGVAKTASALETVLFILSMLCVGFLEEVIFRGLLFKALCRDNVKSAFLVSSVTFGMGHLVNLLNGQELIPTLLQICYAVAIGFLFTAIFYKGKSLWPCILTHGIFNSLSAFSVQSSQRLQLVTAVVLCVVSVGYALWILRTCKEPQEQGNAG